MHIDESTISGADVIWRELAGLIDGVVLENNKIILYNMCCWLFNVYHYQTYWVGRLGINTVVVLNVGESLIHETTVAALVTIVARAYN